MHAAVAHIVLDLTRRRLDGKLDFDHAVRLLEKMGQPGFQVRDVARRGIELLLRDMEGIEILGFLTNGGRCWCFLRLHVSPRPCRSPLLPIGRALTL